MYFTNFEPRFVESRGVEATGQKGRPERTGEAPVFRAIGPYSWMYFGWCKWWCNTFFGGVCKSFYVSAGKCVLNDFDDYLYSSTNAAINNVKILSNVPGQFGQVKDC